VGSMKLTVSLAELRSALSESPGEARRDRPTSPRARGVASPSPVEATPQAPIQTEDNTCDLRGQRADDAIPFATSFLDRALQEGQKVVFLVHGHGTGALREVLRRELRQSRYVAHFRAGETGEGGDGVTVVWLA
jgi:DNA mismatch repair protein MutS2